KFNFLPYWREIKRDVDLSWRELCSLCLHNDAFKSVYSQKAIKEKDIPIEGVEFMGPNRDKADS
uniref:Uncharacterized protein n=1 Tax=Sinocyclocheilus anshuiensis TaxID=1608454 RepID=A0A671L2L5_9TELE